MCVQLNENSQKRQSSYVLIRIQTNKLLVKSRGLDAYTNGVRYPLARFYRHASITPLKENTDASDQDRQEN